jgi:hypothetical protein
VNAASDDPVRIPLLLQNAVWGGGGYGFLFTRGK